MTTVITSELIEASPEELQELLGQLQLAQEQGFAVVAPSKQQRLGSAPGCPNRSRRTWNDPEDPRGRCRSYSNMSRIYDRKTTGAYEYGKQRKRKFVPIGWRCSSCGCST